MRAQGRGLSFLLPRFLRNLGRTEGSMRLLFCGSGGLRKIGFRCLFAVSAFGNRRVLLAIFDGLTFTTDGKENNSL